MPASMALALLELIEAAPGPSLQDEFPQFEHDCIMDLDRIIEASR